MLISCRLRKLTLALCSIAVCGVSAQAPADKPPLPAFDVATIRPDPDGDPKQGSWSRPGMGTFKASHLSLEMLIRLAYGVDAKQILNEPRWLTGNLYDITAKPEAGISLSREELRPRLQDLLQQRFHLVCHTETRDEPGYILVIAKHGAKLTPTHGAPFPGFRQNVNPGNLKGLNWSMTDLATYTSSLIAKPVVDRTGISGSYDFSIEFARDDDATSTLPSLFTALEETCGLKLSAAKVPVQVLVIDSVDPSPTPN